ncbi:MAG TPA: hypothetical protein VGG71_16630 [Chitinophagaceae bacterium]
MPLYRLLRSNKESGPYALDELLALGLKPYDLVWVEGRSAAWRYPSEVSELKEFAPAVEEQPFDRFFKKPSEKETTATTSNEVSRIQEAPQKTVSKNFTKAEPIQKNKEEQSPNIKKNSPEIPNTSSQPQSKKQVFVSMPETIGFDPYANPYHEEKKYEAYLPKPKAKESLPKEERSYSPINIQESEESKLETKYTQSLDDIKEMYINTLVQRKTRNRKKEIASKYLKPALLPLLLVVSGVAIGYFIWNRKTSLQASQTVSKVIPPQTTPDQKKEVAPADQNNLTPNEKENAISLSDNKNKKAILFPESRPQQQKIILPHEQRSQTDIDHSQKENNNSLATSRSLNQPSKEKETNTSITSNNQNQSYQKRNVEVDPSTGERKKVTRDNDVTSDNSNTARDDDRSNKKNGSEYTFLDNEPKTLLNLVSVKSNTYLRGAFGGIRGLELTVSNNSNFLLDEVRVELQIMKPSDQPLRTDIITFRNIGANGAVTVKVPDSQRGIRVEYRITNIESRQWQKTTAGL